MAHKVLETFKEKHDNDRIYEEGKPYPQGDFKPTKKRLKELSTDTNKYGRPFIKEVDDDDKDKG